MGHQSVYADDRSAEFSVCDRGRADCLGNDKDITEPFSDQERDLFRRYLYSAAHICRAVCVLRRAGVRWDSGVSLLQGIFLYLQEISERRRETRGDQAVALSLPVM